MLSFVEELEKKTAVAEWLAHPSELGCIPKKIEFTKQFTLEDGTECYNFKVKKGILSPWILAICCDQGVYSQMQKYNPGTEVVDAKNLVKQLDILIKNKENEQKEREERAKNAGKFLGFPLLSDGNWDYESFEKAFAAEWGSALPEGSQENGAKVYEIPELGEKALLAMGVMNMPIPEGEAEEHARLNYMWKEATQVAATHKAHLMLTVMGADDPLEGGKFFLKVLSAVCKSPKVIGVYYNQTVVQPRFLCAFGDQMRMNQLPLLGLVWFGLLGSEKGVSAYTVGLENFGKDEIEILDAKKKPSEVQEFLINVAGYVLEEDVILHDGETIGGSNTERIMIKKSKGVNVPGESLKILYA